MPRPLSNVWQIMTAFIKDTHCTLPPDQGLASKTQPGCCTQPLALMFAYKFIPGVEWEEAPVWL